MENLIIKTKQTKEVEVEIQLPKYFTLNSYYHYKLLSDSAVLYVNYYTEKIETLTALELFPSIKVEHIRYINYRIKPEDVEPLTEEEFNAHLNAAKKLIWSL